ncbi:hypothetical protein NIES2109_62640 (plasmid) [Nostoc sp. HK-01]|nr:hypothetical protein NIES2109_62640 [Nostoc sp. HK-01]
MKLGCGVWGVGKKEDFIFVQHTALELIEYKLRL